MIENLPTSTLEKTSKTPEEIAAQIGRIANKLGDRAMKVAIGSPNISVEGRLSDSTIKFNAGKVDANGKPVSLSINYREGVNGEYGNSVTLSEGLGDRSTVGPVTGIRVEPARDSMTAYRSALNYEDNKTGLQQPNGDNPNGFSKEELISTAAQQLGAIRGVVAQAEINSKQL